MRITSAQFIKGITGTDAILTDGLPQIAFVGRSNVGKSSVINALVGETDIVKVGRRPGKTTEINFFLINKQFYFVDLPGYGYARLTPDEKEKISKHLNWYLGKSGVVLAQGVMILDVKVGFTNFDREMARLLSGAGHNFIIIANKVDKLNQKETSQQLELISASLQGGAAIPFSALTGQGVEAVLEIFANNIDVLRLHS